MEGSADGRDGDRSLLKARLLTFNTPRIQGRLPNEGHLLCLRSSHTYLTEFNKPLAFFRVCGSRLAGPCRLFGFSWSPFAVSVDCLFTCGIEVTLMGYYILTRHKSWKRFIHILETLQNHYDMRPKLCVWTIHWLASRSPDDWLFVVTVIIIFVEQTPKVYPVFSSSIITHGYNIPLTRITLRLVYLDVGYASEFLRRTSFEGG